MARTHHYAVTVTWTGNTGAGTASYRAYDRRHDIAAEAKPILPGSADPAFRGEASRWNPEELLVASISACHQLWYLHLCADAGIIVTAYVDRAAGELDEDADGAGRFRRVILHPEVTVAAGADEAKALALHQEAHAKCFVANSVNFPVAIEPRIVIGLEPEAKPRG